MFSCEILHPRVTKSCIINANMILFNNKEDLRVHSTSDSSRCNEATLCLDIFEKPLQIKCKQCITICTLLKGIDTITREEPKKKNLMSNLFEIDFATDE